MHQPKQTHNLNKEQTYKTTFKELVHLQATKNGSSSFLRKICAFICFLMFLIWEMRFNSYLFA